MRIIGGKRKGAIIKAPSNLPVRPTMDRNKESLFNILANYFDFEEMHVLDLFSGTGNVAYEFASRESKEVIAVDGFQGCVTFIKKKAQELDFDNLKVIKSDVLKYLQNEYRKYDFIYADPPFAFEKMDEIINLVFDRELLLPDGRFVMEHPSTRSFNQHPHFYESRAFGQCIMSFFRMNNDK
jgi:16S rRNA (guanine966-N2)-methyltransferase